MSIYKSTKRIYLNEAQTAIVPENSVEAHWLLVPAGGEISLELAERYGLTQESQEIEAVEDGQAAVQPENKAILQAPESKPFSSASVKKAKPQ